MRRLPSVSEMEHITSKEFGEKMDAVLLFIRETVRLGRIPFDYTEEDLAEVRRWERMSDEA